MHVQEYVHVDGWKRPERYNTNSPNNIEGGNLTGPINRQRTRGNKGISRVGERALPRAIPPNLLASTK